MKQVTELNKQDELKPDSVRIKVFIGNKCLKINRGSRPYSEFDISKYYVVIVKSHSKRPFFLEIYNETMSLVEFLEIKKIMFYILYLLLQNE